MNHGSFDGSFKVYPDTGPTSQDDIEAGRAGPGPHDMSMFAKEVGNVKEDVNSLEKLYIRIVESNEDIKVAQNAMGMRELRDEMNADLDNIMKLAKQINKKFDGLIRANAAQRRATGSGPGSSDDNDRALMISELGDSIQHMMRKFQGLRVQMETDHRQLIESRYFAITREKATAEAIDNLIANEVPESPLHHAMQDHGRGPVLDAVAEIQERRGTMMETRRSLMALHQVLLGIATPVVVAAAEGQTKGGPPSPVDTYQTATGAGLPVMTKAGPGGLNDFEKETRNQAYIAIAVSMVIIIAVIVALLGVESGFENKDS
ncbi:hypothetical protein CASFOL_029022 [Castilleja foliolosa]|uniref:Syntaxin N-terminal domain-containing protein n=1 Tax=Castilleja foliolosa TaxID=1961234 RepID=A0ABD3CDN9_9LAMI